MEKTSQAVTEDMQMEILLRMPLKALVKFECVSKWAAIIRTKQFRDLYVRRSMKRPRLLFVDYPLGLDVLLHSVYQEEKPLLSSGPQQMQVRHDPELEHQIAYPTRGLICLQENTTVRICNPGARKLMTLPEIQAGEEGDIRSFLGYDEVTDVFKVLCVPKSVLDTSEEAKECQILTVGSGEESWRRIRCKHHHSPVTHGICKGGVLYYGARSNGDNSLVMSFNVRSEEFTVTELPEGANITPRCSFVNYNGTIAIVDDSDFEFGLVTEPNGNGVVEMWVMNETAGNWWRNRIEIPRWEETVGNMNYFFKGTIGTGELVFAADHVFQGPLFVLYYDTAMQNHRRFEIEGLRGDNVHIVRTYLDHVDSPFLI